MTLLTETLIISGTIACLSTLPLLSRRVRKHSKLFFLLGTGALSGLLLFDLLPDLLEMGGSSSLWAAAVVWFVYTAIHLGHLRHHKPAASPELSEDEGEAKHAHHDHGSPLFLASMIAHCLASGMLLVLSDGMAKGINRTVFLALLAHKVYEALTVSSVLIEKQRSKLRAIAEIALYSASLPAGALVTLCFRSTITQPVAILGMSFAVGSLLGCLLFDFWLPSMSQVKHRRLDLGWIFAGLCLTQLVMRVL